MLLKLALRNTLRNKRRTVVLLLVILVGTESLALFSGFNTGIINQYRENAVRAQYGHGQIMMEGYFGQAHAEPWRLWMDDATELMDTLNKLPGVVGTYPRIQFSALLAHQSAILSGRGVAVEGLAEAEFFDSLNHIEGGPLGSQSGIELGMGLAKGLSVEIGDLVSLSVIRTDGEMGNLDLPVVGLFNTGSREMDEAYFRIQLRDAQRLIQTDRVETIAVGLESFAHWPMIVDTLAETEPRLEALRYEELDAIFFGNAVDWLDAQFGVIRLIIVLLAVLAILSVAAALIFERSREVGVMRAGGESRGSMLGLFALEGLILGVVGAALGALIAWLTADVILAGGIEMPPAPGITRQFNVWIELTPTGVLEAVAAGIAAAMIGVTLAAWRISRRPVVALLRHSA